MAESKFFFISKGNISFIYIKIVIQSCCSKPQKKLFMIYSDPKYMIKPCHSSGIETGLILCHTALDNRESPQLGLLPSIT